MEYVPKKLITKEFYLEAIRQNICVTEWIPEDFFNRSEALL